jgi:pilus assembly protein Flp/PilA
MKRLLRLLKGKEGVTAIEYGLIAALIAVAIIVGATSTGVGLDTLFQKISTEVLNISKTLTFIW